MTVPIMACGHITHFEMPGPVGSFIVGVFPVNEPARGGRIQLEAGLCAAQFCGEFPDIELPHGYRCTFGIAGHRHTPIALS